MHPTTIGNRGEQLASEQLIRDGHEIIARNWKTKYCEIDIVARKDNVIYFVEVKYRETTRQGDGFAYITDAKLRHMYRGAEIWCLQHRWHGEVGLLAASVTKSGNTIEFCHVA